jgi:hypothetical protein
MYVQTKRELSEDPKKYNKPILICNYVIYFSGILDMNTDSIKVCFANVLWVAFSIPSGSLSLFSCSYIILFLL